jgi:RNA polymerase sigma-70 factor (ECF subfamily)
MPDEGPPGPPPSGQDDRYFHALAEFGPALERLTRAYERAAEPRRDLMQEIHFALWRSFAVFDGKCSLRTWVYRVAHNVASTHAGAEAKRNARSAGAEPLDHLADAQDAEAAAEQRQALRRLTELIRALPSIDRQIMLLYLEDLDAAATAEIVGLTPGAVAVRIHRLKDKLARQMDLGGAP